MARDTPRVEGATLIDSTDAARAMLVGTPAWYAWLEQATTFAFVGASGRFTARKERRGRAAGYWKAYRKRAGVVRSAYLGKTTDLTLERLQAAAASLAETTLAGDAPGQSVTDRAAPSSEQAAHTAPTLPSGTVTFLFTDIEGSTQLWEQYPQAMPAALARHDTIVREAIHMYGGVVFKSVGDGVHAVFALAGDALSAVLAAQRGLHAEPWGSTGALRVRMALHTGAAEERDGDYFGAPLNRVARILALGHGGQILLSRATHDLVADDLPDQTTLRDLGEYHLKDLSRPEHVFQIVTPNTPADFPPLRTPDVRPARSPPAAPLLATKLYIPAPRPHLVPRPRLLAQLAAGLAEPLTLLSAPAGFGKTTLVSAWLAARTEGQELRTESTMVSLSPQSSALGTRVAWLSLDTADNDPTCFWRYVIAAIETVRPGIGEPARIALAAPQPAPIEAILTTLINALAKEPPEPAPLVLVLDDYHIISTPAIHDGLTFLLDQLPPQLRLILTSRIDPPLPLARWRVRNHMTEIRAAELRFTPEEAAIFLTDTMGLALSPAEVAALEARTEGWIAGLHLAALAMRDRSDLTGFIAAFTGSNYFVVDYLVAEVFTRQPAHIQQFLLHTAILDRMCGPLCDAVLGLTTTDHLPPTTDDTHSISVVGRQSSVVDSYSQLILNQLERANLFLVPLDDERHWYRYHHLFADVMQARLYAGSSPTEVARLHGRASLWYEQHGLLDASLRHALAAHDVDRAVQLVERNYTVLMTRGDVQLLGMWLRQLPAQYIAERPLLALAHAWVAALTGQPAEAERRLGEAALLRSPSDLPADIRAGLALLRSNIALSGHDPHVTETFAREALEQLHPGQADYDIWRAVAVRNIGIAAVQRKDIPTAQQALDEGARLGVASNNLFLALAALGVLGRVQLQSGQLSAALQTGQRTLAIGAEHRIVPLAAGIASIGIGEASCERNELGVAIHYLERGIELLTQQSVELYALARGYVALARAQHGQGQAEAALTTLRRSMDWFVQAAISSPRAGMLLAAYQARIQLWGGDRATAASWAAGRQLSSDWTPVIDPGIDECLSLVRIVIAQREPGPLAEALRWLDQLARDAETASLLGVLIEIHVLRALALQAQGNLAAALTALESALKLAAPEGYVRLFMDEGAPMAALLAQVVRDESQFAAYAATLLQAFSRTEGRGLRTEPAASTHSVLSPQSSALVEPLSERELEILRLIADGHSNQAIADRLVVAVGTVKKHINNLYGKLDVQSRTQALVRARQLNLL